VVRRRCGTHTRSSSEGAAAAAAAAIISAAADHRVDSRFRRRAATNGRGGAQSRSLHDSLLLRNHAGSD